MEERLKHLEFITAAINRMANNAFLLRGWSISLAGGLVALSFKEYDHRYLFVSLMVLGFFWCLDGYYLSRERLFVKLYENVAQEQSSTGLSMNTARFSARTDWVSAMCSGTELIFYGGLALVHVLILINT